MLASLYTNCLLLSDCFALSGEHPSHAYVKLPKSQLLGPLRSCYSCLNFSYASHVSPARSPDYKGMDEDLVSATLCAQPHAWLLQL
jgi:hypothetical protein